MQANIALKQSTWCICNSCNQTAYRYQINTANTSVEMVAKSLLVGKSSSNRRILYSSSNNSTGKDVSSEYIPSFWFLSDLNSAHISFFFFCTLYFKKYFLYLVCQPPCHPSSNMNLKWSPPAPQQSRATQSLTSIKKVWRTSLFQIAPERVELGW